MGTDLIAVSGVTDDPTAGDCGCALISGCSTPPERLNPVWEIMAITRRAEMIYFVFFMRNSLQIFNFALTRGEQSLFQGKNR